MSPENIVPEEDPKKDSFESEARPTVKIERYSNSAEINGIEILVNWVGYDYEIFFPKIDRVIKLGEDPLAAKAVFEFAKAMAKKCSGVEELFDLTGTFIADVCYS